MGCQLLLHEAYGFFVLATIPLNCPVLYFVLANEICTGKYLSHLSLSCFILGNTNLFIELYRM